MATGKYDSEKAETIKGVRNRNKVDKTIPQSQVETARQQSIQARATDTSDFQNPGASGVDAFIGTQIARMMQITDTIPGWWSPSRDLALSALWKASNLLSGAMYMMASKIATIPWRVEPVDQSIDQHIRDAQIYQERIFATANYGQGWGSFIKQQVQSLLGTDNGRFMEIIDMSDNKNGPIVGPALSIAHLDPHRCRRISNPEFPILYLDIEGNLHQMHYTRIAFESQLPSEHATMYNMGFCGVSRATHYAQHMLDIGRFKEEKLGSRPLRGLMLVGGGLDPEAVGDAFAIARGAADDMNLDRFSTIPIVGNPEFDDPSLELITVSSLPDGFDEDTATNISMAAISLAFGVDARELWPNMVTAASRADTLTQHIKQRGKGPGDIINETERMFDTWVLPSYLKFKFDYQDDAQDRQRAEINVSRSKKRVTDIDTTVSDIRTEREMMVTNGEITKAQFNKLELKDGRRPNGIPLETMFFDDDPFIQNILTLSGITDPLDVRGNDKEEVLDAISKQVPIALEAIQNEKRETLRDLAEQSLAALQFLSEAYSKDQLPTGLAEEIAPEVLLARENEEAAESELPGDVDDEQNMAIDNSPRELKVQQVIPYNEPRRKAQQLIMDKLFEPEPIIIEFKPEINVTPPETKVIVNVPETNINVDIPEIVIPKIEIPTIEMPTIEIPAPIMQTQTPMSIPVSTTEPIKELDNDDDNNKYDVFDLERDKMGEIISVKRRKVNE